MAERIREIRSDPCNQRIARVEGAGEIVDGHLVTHNGLLVKPFDRGYMQLLQANGGCHEPQEELLFQEVLRHIRRGGCILELGAYWAFYSMWFAKEVPESRCILVEPKRRNLKVGKYNFARNEFRGEFFRRRVGSAHLSVDRFLDARELNYVDVLHADIQGAEYEMLCDARQSLQRGRIGYVLLGTHGQDLHYWCKSYLEQHGYITLAHADVDYGTYCCDGVLAARRQDLEGLGPLDIPLRDPDGQHRAERQMRDLAGDAAAQPVQPPPSGLGQRLKRKVCSRRC